MRKYVIGMFAAAMGASSVSAGQGSMANYDAALMAPAAAWTALSKASTSAATINTGSFQIRKSTQDAAGGHYDAQLGKPTFLWAGSDIQPAIAAPVKGSKLAESAAREYLLRQSDVLQLSKGTVGDAKLVHVHDLGRGPLIARFQQMHDGIEVFGQQMNVMMNHDMKLVATSGYFAPQDSAATYSKTARSSASSAHSQEAFTMAPERAIALAFADFSGQPLNPSKLSIDRTADDYTVFRMSGVQNGEIRLESEPRAKKVFYYVDGSYEPAYYVEVAGRSVDAIDAYAYGYVISATDGKVLFRKDQIDYDYSYRAYADASGINQPYDSPLGNALAPFTGTAPNGVQTVPRAGATLNLVTLDHGPISTGDPWLPAGQTVTTGNNVEAYLDLFGTVDASGNILSGDGFQNGTTDQRASTTGANTFDYSYTPDTDPSTPSQRNFAIVNLFYVNNWLHDWWYDNGFNESAGNAQTSNFGRGGVAGDSLKAEGQDFSGRNNANESTPADGGRPRQQMYLFDGAVNGEVTITAPSGIGTLAFNTAAFGPSLFDVSGTIVSSAPLNACTPFTNAAAVAGNIVLVDRGSCSFQTKTVNAQNAGATAVIVANNVAGAAPGLAGDATQPAATIGTLSVSQTDGQRIRAALNPGPVTGRVRRAASTDIDGTVDIQVIAHEWFHTTSNRLVGNASGLSNQQGRGMGEGWSDFSAQLLTVRPEDRQVAGNNNYQGAYASGYYVTRDVYYGIRRAPYSTSFAFNPLTFRHISNGVALPTTAPFSFGQNGASNSEVHNTGEIWCNTLWEVYAALLNDPRYSFTQARERMKSYVVAGLMMTPNAPTMLEARDGLLAAARASDSTGADFRLMATAFAKRGMGAGAVAPARTSTTNANAIEDYTVFAGRLTVTTAALDFGYINGAAGYIDNDGVLDPGETALMTISVVNNGTDAITTPVVGNLTSNGDVTFGGGGQLTFPASANAPIAIGQTVTATVEVKLNSATTTAQALTLTLAFAQSGAHASSVFEPAPVTFNLIVNYDLQPNALASDNFEQPLTSARDWSAVLAGGGANWILRSASGLVGTTGTGWFAADNTAPSDVRLTTPVLQATTGFSIVFDHYFSFEFAGVDPSTTPPTNVGYDGGIIEISTNNGASWTDVVDAGGRFTTGNGYNGIFLALAPDGTTLTPDDSGRHPGFVNNNGSTSTRLLEHIVLSFGNAFAGKAVRLRFREVTDNGGSSIGWWLDNVSFTGIGNLPFSAVVANAGVPSNQPPVANAGPDQVAGLSRLVTLDGTASTDDAGVTNYAWTQMSGPATAALSGASTARPTFTPTVAGAYVFKLTVQDVRTASSGDTVSVTVLANPVANAGAAQRVNIRDGVSLNGRGSTVDPASTINYAWVQTGGPAVTLANANTTNPSFTANAIGTPAFQLTVTDTRTGVTSTDSTTVTVGVPPGGGSFGLALFGPGLLALLLRRRGSRR
ncbi:MAG: hypothetical protein NVS9B10_19760 [Nevskia sp.]